MSSHDPVVLYVTPDSYADLSATSSATPASAKAGQTMAFTVNVRNLGPDFANFVGVGFAFDAELPNLKIVPSESIQGCDEPLVSGGSTSVACVVSMMGSDGGMSFTLTATAPASKVGGQVHLAVMVDSAEIDLAGGNNKPSASVSIAP